MADMFPDDITTDILLRVPVKSLLRFRCVSKTWCALIDCKYFVERHLNHSILNKTNQKLIISNFAWWNTSELNSLNQTLDRKHPVYHPYSGPAPRRFVGSCNGLLCLYYEENEYYLFGGMTVIWNPATKKHVKLSNPADKSDDYRAMEKVRGFGYDSLSDDYKVVMLMQFSSQKEVHVYSMRSNSWRKPLVFLGQYTNYKCGILACGALHWLVLDSRLRQSVYAFDLSTELFKIVPLPDSHYDKVSIVSISELGGCLSITSRSVSDYHICDVWVMKEYGVRQSWTKLFTLSGITRLYFNVDTLAYSESGDKVLIKINFKTLIWYNLEKRTLDSFANEIWIHPCSHALMILESLVSLGGQAEHDVNYCPYLLMNVNSAKYESQLEFMAALQN